MILADEFDAFLIDLDGVIYVGDTALPGVREALQELRQRGKRLLFLTNDPRSSRRYYCEKLRGLRIPAAEHEILTSGAATAQYISQHEKTEGRTAFVVGTAALKNEIEQTGLKVVEGEPGRYAEFVVVGGHEDFHYRELRVAALAVRGGARFYATNRDPTFPMPDGPWPAVGAILSAVEVAAGRTAKVIGKPEPYMFEAASSLLGTCHRIAVIGDSPQTDIEGGRRAGMSTILVGAWDEQLPESERPDFVVRSLPELLDANATDPRSGGLREGLP
ncbi:MAG: HAD-IIA family hydrolase [Actinomycetota bacterium]|nr:HAD-IIA family hydrolase [Actinomycetota bacterium]